MNGKTRPPQGKVNRTGSAREIDGGDDGARLQATSGSRKAQISSHRLLTKAMIFPPPRRGTGKGRGNNSHGAGRLNEDRSVARTRD